MITKENLRNIVLRQKDRHKKESFIQREIFPELKEFLRDKRILIISGMRRVGKSTLLYQLMKDLDEQEEKYCYVNFEDEKFLDFQAKDFEDLNEVLIEIYGEPKYYFFDEIQNIENFESFTRRLHDEKNKIILTGSNSSLLSKELGTKLTGRYKTFELYPFSFKEFLKFKNIEYNKKTLSSTREKVRLLKAFKRYFDLGGIPEYLENEDLEYIKTIYDNIIYRDIITRYGIRNQKTFRELVNMLSTNISSQFSYNSLKKSLGLSNSMLVKEYIHYLTNSYLFFELKKFDYSKKKQLNSPKKSYFVDPIFSKIVGFNFSKNNGRLLENYVFSQLKRTKKEVFYYQEKGECDFTIKENLKITEAIQVCYSLHEDNKKREINGLVEALEKFNLKKGLILTLEQEDELRIKDKKITIKPVWKWLLE